MLRGIRLTHCLKKQFKPLISRVMLLAVGPNEFCELFIQDTTGVQGLNARAEILWRGLLEFYKVRVEYAHEVDLAGYAIRGASAQGLFLVGSEVARVEP